MNITENQIVYIWHDPELGASKIGKTNSLKRFELRVTQGFANNPRIRFVGAWQSNIAPKAGDAGEVAAHGFPRVRFASTAREWFQVEPDAAAARCTALFGQPIVAEPPPKAVARPYDIMSSKPSADGLSRVWVHLEGRPQGLIKVSDNSWWRPNLNAEWANTFNPMGFSMLGAFEWPGAERDPPSWLAASERCRAMKNALQDRFPAPSLLPVQRIGWLSADYAQVREMVLAGGFAAFDPAAGIRRGVRGQGEAMP